MSKFNAGDLVTWINGYGIKFPERRIERVDTDVQDGELRYFIENSDTPWFSIRESKLIPDNEDVVLEVVGGHKIRSMLVERDFTDMENDFSVTVKEMFLVGLTKQAFVSIFEAKQFANDNPIPSQAAPAMA